MSKYSNAIFDPKMMAKSIKTYMDMFDRYVVKTDMDADEYKKAKKTIKKLIKHLENGEIDKVVDPERYEEACQIYEENSNTGGMY